MTAGLDRVHLTDRGMSLQKVYRMHRKKWGTSSERGMAVLVQRAWIVTALFNSAYFVPTVFLMALQLWGVMYRGACLLEGPDNSLRF